MGFKFAPVRATGRKKEFLTRLDPVLYSNSDNPKITIIVNNQIVEYKTHTVVLKNGKKKIIEGEEVLLNKIRSGNATISDKNKIRSFSENNLKGVIQLFEKLLNKTFQILAPFDYTPELVKLRTGFSKYYKKNSVDYTKLIPKNSIVIPIGTALSSLVGDTLRVDFFYDTILNETNFYHSEIQCQVFPIDNFYSWNKDWYSFEYKFIKMQTKFVNEFVHIRTRKVKNLEVIEIKERSKFLLESLNKNVEVAIDTETNGLDYMLNSPFCLTISFDGFTGYFIDLKGINKKLLSEWFKGKKLVCANGKFDIKMLHHNFGIPIENMYLYFDIIQAHHVVNELSNHSLKVQTWLYTKFGGYEDELDLYKEKYKIKDYSKIPKSIIKSYATKDAIITFKIYKELEKRLKKLDDITYFYKEQVMKTSSYFYEVVMASLRMFIDIELSGMFVNLEELRKVGNSVSKEIRNLENDFLQEMGLKTGNINLNSDDQLGKLFENRGWNNYGKSKKGIYLTNADTLNRWVKDGKQSASILLKLNSLKTIMSTFVGEENKKSGLWQYIRSHEDGSNRIHSSFAVMLAGSGRMKSSKPNFQNFPSHGKEAKMIKKFFIPPSKDYVFLSADASGIQLRIVGRDANEEKMIYAFKNLGGDLHSITACSAILNDKYSIEDFLKLKKEGNEEVLKARYQAKQLNFLLLFGGTAGLVYRKFIDLNWSEEEADQYCFENNLKILEYQGKSSTKFTVAVDLHKRFFEIYPSLVKWRTEKEATALKNGYVKSIYGAIRRVPHLKEDLRDINNGKRVSNLESIILNSPVQNIETVMMQRSGSNLKKWLKKRNKEEGKEIAIIFSFIHDAIELYVLKEYITEVAQKVKEIFEQDYSEYNKIPFPMEGNIADYYNNELWDMGKDWEEIL